MTDKEQIMIDGVDISECKKSWCSLKTCSGFRCAKWHILKAAQEKYKYKTIEEQLARKTQECEKLTNKNNLLTAELNQTKLLLEGKNTQYNTLLEEIENYKINTKTLRLGTSILASERDRYRKALEEIKRICLEDTYTFTDGTTIRYDTLDDILDIVNREEGEKNE